MFRTSMQLEDDDANILMACAAPKNFKTIIAIVIIMTYQCTVSNNVNDVSVILVMGFIEHVIMFLVVFPGCDTVIPYCRSRYI